jgi:hypothetical protein
VKAQALIGGERLRPPAVQAWVDASLDAAADAPSDIDPLVEVWAAAADPADLIPAALRRRVGPGPEGAAAAHALACAPVGLDVDALADVIRAQPGLEPAARAALLRRIRADAAPSDRRAQALLAAEAAPPSADPGPGGAAALAAARAALDQAAAAAPLPTVDPDALAAALDSLPPELAAQLRDPGRRMPDPATLGAAGTLLGRSLGLGDPRAPTTPEDAAPLLEALRQQLEAGPAALGPVSQLLGAAAAALRGPESGADLDALAAQLEAMAPAGPRAAAEAKAAQALQQRVATGIDGALAGFRLRPLGSA